MAVNSYNNALIPLLISNQFIELKGMVFKRCEKNILFQISCSGLKQFFFLFFLLLFISIYHYFLMFFTHYYLIFSEKNRYC